MKRVKEEELFNLRIKSNLQTKLRGEMSSYLNLRRAVRLITIGLQRHSDSVVLSPKLLR
jgi:hypothetical protein